MRTVHRISAVTSRALSCPIPSRPSFRIPSSLLVPFQILESAVCDPSICKNEELLIALLALKPAEPAETKNTMRGSSSGDGGYDYSQYERFSVRGLAIPSVWPMARSCRFLRT